MKKIALFVLVSLSATLSFAQDLKIGFTSAVQILPHMPDFQTAETEMKAYTKLLQDQLAQKEKDFQTKLTELGKMDVKNTPPIILQEKQKELEQLRQAYQEFGQNIQKDVQAKRVERMQPLYDQIQKSIDVVAKAENYTLILNGYDGTGTSLILYFDKSQEETLDVTNLVLKQMGITPPAKTEGN